MCTQEWIGGNPPNRNYGDGDGSGWGRTLGCLGHTAGSGHGVLGFGDNYAGADAGNGAGVSYGNGLTDGSGYGDGYGYGNGFGTGYGDGNGGIDGSGRGL